MRYHYTGLNYSSLGPYGPAVVPPPWEVTKIVGGLGQIPAHPSPYHPSTLSPPLVMGDIEDTPQVQLRLDHVIDSIEAPEPSQGLLDQITMMTFIGGEDGYPDAEQGVYGQPSMPPGWTTEAGQVMDNLQTWNETTVLGGTPNVAPLVQDALNMRTAARYLTDLFLGYNPESAALLPVAMKAWAPQIYTSSFNLVQQARRHEAALTVAMYCRQYARKTYNYRMKIVPFINSKFAVQPFDVPGNQGFMTDEEFIQTQLTPCMHVPALTGVYYWQKDGLQIASAMSGDAGDLAIILNDIPPELAVEPYDWPAIANWYVEQHLHYMDLVTTYVVDQT